jgi:hypothetical protein
LFSHEFRFAFVEYEDRRDADDAYHDMHNKRIGRDDILKIEVSCQVSAANPATADISSVGPHSSFRFMAV